MAPELSLEFIQKLPKTDLHCHLDGSLRLKTMLELADQQGVKLPPTAKTAWPRRSRSARGTPASKST